MGVADDTEKDEEATRETLVSAVHGQDGAREGSDEIVSNKSCTLRHGTEVESIILLVSYLDLYVDPCRQHE
jgi:hypothetical protein